LILKDGSAEKRAKRLQEYESEGFSLAGGWGGKVSCRGNMKNVIISVYRLSSTFLERMNVMLGKFKDWHVAQYKE